MKEINILTVLKKLETKEEIGKKIKKLLSVNLLLWIKSEERIYLSQVVIELLIKSSLKIGISKLVLKKRIAEEIPNTKSAL